MNRECDVLIIDDDEHMLTVLTRELRTLGYRCHCATDGKAGLKHLRDTAIEVALVDLDMPIMNGFELLEALRKNPVSTVPIVLTGYSDTQNAVRALKLGAFDFLEKPCRRHEVDIAVQRALRHHQALSAAEIEKAAAAQWESTFNAWPEMVFILDTQNRIVRCNNTASGRALPVSGGPCTGMNIHDALCGADHAAANCLFTTLSAGASTTPSACSCALLGIYYEIVTAPLFGPAGLLQGCMMTLRDITLRRAAVLERSTALRETARMLSAIRSILIMVDGNNTIRQWNTTAEEVFMIPARQVVGTDFDRCPITWDIEEVKKHVSLCLHNGSSQRLDNISYTTVNGKKGLLGLSIHPLRQNKKLQEGFVLIGADITERKKMEVELSHARKMESIGQLAAGIAHEINTPTQYVGDNTRFLQDIFSDITALVRQYEKVLEAAKQGTVNQEIIDAAEQAAQKADMDYLADEIPRAIGQTLEGVERISKIVRSMKEFSHPGSVEKTPVDINRAIESTITVARNEWKYVAELVTDFDNAMPPIMCLPGDFNQVILNLIINAAHAIASKSGDGENGKGTISIRTRLADNQAEIRIADTGSGIPQEISDRVFDPFFTTKEVGKGTGQGLAIASSVIREKHGGTITFTSTPGDGTEFIIRLPVQAAPNAGGDA